MSDFHSAFRSLIKTPGFTLVALLTLALGIGLNTAMFNIVNSLVLQPLKFPDPENLARIQRVNRQQQPDGGHRPANLLEIARSCADIAEVVCSRSWSFTLSEPGRPPEVLSSVRASAGYFHVLGLPMKLGREFLSEEDAHGRNRVIVLSHGFWLSHFGGDPKVIGQTVRLDGEANVIIGVAPEAASDPRTIGKPEIYRPLALTTEETADRVDHAYDLIARFHSGATAAQIETRFAAVATSLATSDPAEFEGRTLRAVSLRPDLRGTGRQIIFTLIGLSGFVLLIACANLANLSLARAIARGREFAIRGALGASRAQLVRPLVFECTLLALLGGGLGLMVCTWTNFWMAREFSVSGTDFAFVTDWKLLVYGFGISLATGLCFGVAPAWVTAHVPVNDALKRGTLNSTGSRGQNRFRQVLIAGQFALALVLLSGAVFFARGLTQILNRDSGWNPAPLLRGILVLPGSRYPDAASMMRFYDQVQEKVSHLPGVTSAAICYDVPAFGFKSGHGFIIEGRPPAAPGQEVGAPINGVTPGYFETLNTRLVRGRDFAATDRMDSPPVIILNETMARTLFPGEDAVGRRLAYSDEKQINWMEIIGVVADVRPLNFGNTSATFQAYIPLSQSTWSYVALCIRSSVPPATLGDTVRLAVASLDPDMPVKELSPVPDFINRSLQDFHAIIQLMIGFAVLGLFLAALGIYSVISRLVAQRTTEIGIRMALGAQVGQIARLIMGSGLRLVLAGTAVGVLGAVALSRFLNSSLPGIATNGLSAIVATVTLLIAVALVACWLPARRATKVNPMIALRTE